MSDPYNSFMIIYHATSPNSFTNNVKLKPKILQFQRVKLNPFLLQKNRLPQDLQSQQSNKPKTSQILRRPNAKMHIPNFSLKKVANRDNNRAINQLQHLTKNQTCL